MADKFGSSSYKNGDGGGSYGDYHGVSTNWLADRIASGAVNSSVGRVFKFNNKMNIKSRKGGRVYNRDKYKAAVAMGKFANQVKGAMRSAGK